MEQRASCTGPLLLCPSSQAARDEVIVPADRERERERERERDGRRMGIEGFRRHLGNIVE